MTNERRKELQAMLGLEQRPMTVCGISVTPLSKAYVTDEQLEDAAAARSITAAIRKQLRGEFRQ